MPQLGHALVGMGIGAASAEDVRPPIDRVTWIAACTTLSFGPDLVEWMLGVLGRPVPHAAPSSVAATTVGAIALVVVFRGLLRQRWRVTLVGAGLYVSHSVLDFFAGGTPIWWPWSMRVVGPDWMGVDSSGLLARFTRELAIFGPVLGLGAIAGAIRRRRRRPCEPLAARRPRVQRSRLRAAIGVLVAVLPLAVVATAQIHAWFELARGDVLRGAGDVRAACEHYRAARLLRPVDAAASYYNEASCLRRLGDDMLAEALYCECLEEYPDSLTCKFGLGLLYGSTMAPGLRDRARAIALLDEVAERSPSSALRSAAQRQAAAIRAAPSTQAARSERPGFRISEARP